MAAQEIENPAAPAIVAFTTLLEEFLSQAETAKQTSAIEPALRKSDFDDLSGRVSTTAANVSSPAAEGATLTVDKGRQFAIIETAARNIFSQLIVNPDSPLRSAPCADQNRRQPPSILPTTSRCGTYSTSCRFFPTMGNVILRYCFG
jgi:hypothetical protein